MENKKFFNEYGYDVDNAYRTAYTGSHITSPQPSQFEDENDPFLVFKGNNDNSEQVNVENRDYDGIVGTTYGGPQVDGDDYHWNEF